MQLGNDFQGKQCARCGRTIHSDPAYEDDLWWHAVCLAEGKKELQRAKEIAARFRCPPEDPCNS